ncbi:MAG: hypothetical protein R3B90_12155 [Planctomycetaceae bacterium]
MACSPHYVDPTSGLIPANVADSPRLVSGDTPLWYGFAFRMIAGVVFALLLLFRWYHGWLPRTL